MTSLNEEREALHQMLGGIWIAQAISVAARLGVADHLVDGPKTAEELAAKTGAHAASLHRLLRALASIGIFHGLGDGRYELTPMGDCLRWGLPDNACAMASVMGVEMYQAWANLEHSVQTGEPAFDKTFGKPVFQHLMDNPDRGKLFDAMMQSVHGPETAPMVAAYDFAQFGTVVDVGGGNGTTMEGILSQNPDVKGVVFDLPPVIERTATRVAGTALEGRCELVGGSFFESVPTGGDAYVLRHILHDWDDAKSIEILRQCREAMHEGGKVLIVETVIPLDSEPCFGKWLDLMMLVIGGKERTEAEYAALLEKAGLKLNRIVPTGIKVSVVEAVVG